MRLVLAAARAVLAASVLSGCAVPAVREQARREQLSQRLVDDAMALNEAYHGAINGQILLNILRARDRLPRQYTSMSGFTQNGGARTGSFSVGGVDLGQVGQSWGAGEIGGEISGNTAPDYSVAPFATDAFANIALRPTHPRLFQYYWDAGWNRDLLVALMVDSVAVETAQGARTILRNSPGTIANDCVGAANDENGCAFVIAMRALITSLSDQDRVPPEPPANPAEDALTCAPFAVYVQNNEEPKSKPARAAKADEEESEDEAEPPPCPPAIMHGDVRYTFGLRSLDDMIYYVGELIRLDPAAQATPGEWRARLGVAAPGFPIWSEVRTPLFRVKLADDASERSYAASVSYAGARYSAGAPVDRFCYVEGNVDACRTNALLDRSGSVLEMLVGVLSFNQSAAAVAAPQNTIFDRR